MEQKKNGLIRLNVTVTKRLNVIKRGSFYFDLFYVLQCPTCLYYMYIMNRMVHSSYNMCFLRLKGVINAIDHLSQP